MDFQNIDIKEGKMQRTVALLIGLISLLLLPGCASRAVIADLESDKAIIQLRGNDFNVADAKAEEACGIHRKRAQQVSHTCVGGGYCYTKNVLYACK